jgi:hypothetical protein
MSSSVLHRNDGPIALPHCHPFPIEAPGPRSMFAGQDLEPPPRDGFGRGAGSLTGGSYCALESHPSSGALGLGEITMLLAIARAAPRYDFDS